MLLGIDLNRRASYEAQAGMVEVIVRPLVHGHVLGDRAVPDVEIEREERADSGSCLRVPVSEIVLTHLTVIVGKAIGISFGLRKEEQPRVLIGVGGEQNDFCRLKIFLSVSQVQNTGGKTAGATYNPRYLRLIENSEILRLLRFRDGGYGG